jgi:hypothetical protein
MASVPESTVWTAAGALIDRAASLDDLRAHRLQLLAASLCVAQGRPVPAELRADRRYAATMALAAPTLLARARSAYDGPLMLIKGPEVAAGYPESAARHFRDLDLLAADPDAAQRALLAAGFEPSGWDEHHHLRPLRWPGLPLTVEIHRLPKLPRWLPEPDPADFFAGAVPSRTGVDGLLAPSPEVHALVLAAHAWSHRPLGRAGDLLDIAAVLPPELWHRADALARRWGWTGMWRITVATARSLLGGEGRPPLIASLCARNLFDVRDLSVLEYHALRLLAPLAAVPKRRAPAVLADWAAQLGRKWTEETWSQKLARSARAAANALARKSAHDLSTNHHPWGR